ncbi:50S ribosomal protein L24 [Spiroplasma endosymbiont of Polydrusus pterygomalis]|uniref:50S ribosomal protein L24 n=1 Tax=Spiroplasma endosymbiont of Polydrusus pterygomalis TaxID=3139327 RepID=UPI003CCB17A8
MASKKKPVISLDTKLKRGDQVKIIAGKHKGHTGPIIEVLREKNRVIIEGISTKKNKKPTQNDQEGGIVEIKASVHISNVMILDGKKDKKVTKIGYKIDKDGKKIRIARRSETELR